TRRRRVPFVLSRVRDRRLDRRVTRFTAARGDYFRFQLHRGASSAPWIRTTTGFACLIPATVTRGMPRATGRCSSDLTAVTSLTGIGVVPRQAAPAKPFGIKIKVTPFRWITARYGVILFGGRVGGAFAEACGAVLAGHDGVTGGQPADAD